MDKTKLLNMAKTMKWAPVVLGLLSMVFALATMMLQVGSNGEKGEILIFAAFGIFGVVTMVFGLGMAYLFQALVEITEKVEKGEENELDDVDVVA